MTSFATHRNSRRAGLLAATALALSLLGCPADEGSDVDLDNAILVNEASDEVLGTIADAVDNGLFTVDDDKAASIVSPEPGVSVPRGTPLQFAWSIPNGKLRHGTGTGEFVWMRLSGGGLARDIDMIAVGVTSWTPTAEEWSEISSATGTITITLTSAFVMDGIIKEGPYRATSPTSFSIVP